MSGEHGRPGEEDAWGGVLGVTKGLHAKHRGRLMDTPLSESAYIGAAIGAAACGMRPIAELMFIDFAGVCFDQILNQAAKFKYMFGGKAETPVVIRAMVGAGSRRRAAFTDAHPDLHPYSRPEGRLPLQCLRRQGSSHPIDPRQRPGDFLRAQEPLWARSDVRADAYAIPFGEANVVREGRDVTIVTYGLTVHRSVEAAEKLAKEGIEAEVIDLRTLSPIDWDTVLESVTATGRLVAVDEAHPRCSIASDVIAYVSQHAFGALKAAPQMVTAPHTPVPFSPALEDRVHPIGRRHRRGGFDHSEAPIGGVRRSP